MLGTVDRGRVLDVVEAVVSGDATKLLEGVASIAEHAPDYGATLDELIGVFHQLTTLQLVPRLGGWCVERGRANARLC